MPASKYNPGDFIFFTLASLLGFFLFLGSPPVLNGAEAQLAEMAREMALTADFLRPQLYFQVQPWHPPLLLWLQALFIEFLGAQAWAIRLPAALFSLASVLQLYTLGTQLQGRLFGRLAAVLYLGGIFVLGGGRLGLAVGATSLFLLLALGQGLQHEQLSSEKAGKDAGPWAAGFWLGLASLSAGPWTLLLALGAYLLPRLAFPYPTPWRALLKSLAGWAVLTFGWYGLQGLMLGPGLLDSLLAPIANLLHLGEALSALWLLPFLLLGIPSTLFLFRAKAENTSEKRLLHLAFTWLIIVLLLAPAFPRLLSGMIMLGLIPAALLGALGLTHLIRQQAKAPWESYVLSALALILLGLLPSLINLLVNNLDLLIGYFSQSGLADHLKQEVSWSGWEWLIGAAFLLGFTFNLLQLREKRYVSFAYLQLLLGLIFAVGIYGAVLPKLTRYSQGPVEDFFRTRAGQDFYVIHEGYESALPWFYGQVKPIRDARAHDPEWLIEGAVSKDVYLVAPVSVIDRAFQARFRGFQKLYEEGGFAFFQRKKIAPSFGLMH